jgi:hypothetical protein
VASRASYALVGSDILVATVAVHSELWAALARPFEPTTLQPEVLEGNAVEPEDAPTQGTFFFYSHVIDPCFP